MKDIQFLRVRRKARFTDGERERRILRERYADRLRGLTDRERTCWELGFDYGVDDPGVEEDDRRTRLVRWPSRSRS